MIFSGLIAAVIGAVSVYNPVYPVMVEQPHNIISQVEIESDGTGTLDYVDFEFSGIPSSSVRNVRLMYSGTMSCLFRKSATEWTTSIAMLEGFRFTGGGLRIWEDPSYVMQKAEVKPGKAQNGVVRVRFTAPVKLVKGVNYFYVSMEIGLKGVKLTDRLDAAVTGVSVDGKSLEISQFGPNEGRRLAVLLRNSGDFGVHTYRIPGLVTTNKGTIVAVYDLRWNNAQDLNDNIDVAVSRSTDGGRTWSRNITAIDMGCSGGLPESQNGVGDPCILLDQKTGYLYVMGLWSHGVGQSWSSRADGVQYPIEWAQPVIVCSKDDGRTWSAPVFIYDQVAKPGVIRPFQGPGRGITMTDGTLVFPFQHIETGESFAGNSIVYSKDHGATWLVSENTCGHMLTESQVAEIEPGVLILNARNHDKKNPGRVVYTTSDLGKTWTEHPSSHILQEPVCMGSLLNVPAKGSPLIAGGSVAGNNLGTDILLFSNPDTPRIRMNMTIKASFDKGNTWPKSILLDEGEGWGYSCMSMIDDDTVGILYESGVGQLLFQAVPLKDFLE